MHAPIASSAMPVSANEVFTPTRPRSGRSKLVGREAELARIVEALNDEAAHVVIYGERGRGKTSLANLAVERLRRSGTIVGRTVCDAASSFDQILNGVVRDLPSSIMSLDPTMRPAHPSVGCDSIFPKTGVQPSDVAAIRARLSCDRLVFVIDEFDRVEDRETRTRLADTIKLLSDRGLKLYFMIVGVSSTLEDIIGQHFSIQRNIAAVHLPLLEPAEITTLLKTSSKSAGIVFSNDACAIVGGVARGMPYMAQLMGLRIVQQTLGRGATETSRDDVAAAIQRLLRESSQDVANRYTMLTSGPRGEAMRVALDEILAAPQDCWARIEPIGVEPDLLDTLLNEQIIENCSGLPDRVQPADRRFINHVLLLRAQDILASSAIIGERVLAEGSYAEGSL